MSNHILNLHDDELYSSNEEYIRTEKYLNINKQNMSNKNVGGEGNIGKDIENNPEEEMPEEEKFFKDFTNQEIDNRDPSLKEHLIKIYEEEVPFEIKYEDQNIKNEKNFQNLLCKILITEEMIEDINIIVEIEGNEDLFFYYTIDINLDFYENLKKNQKLTCNFIDFADLLIKYFDLCMNNEKLYKAILNIQKDKKANMKLMENLEYKFVQLISLNLSPAPEELIKKQIIYRYNSIRALNDITQNRIDIVNKVLKDLDPPLIQEVKYEITKEIDNNPNLINLNKN